MNISFSACKQVQPLVNIPNRLRMDTFNLRGKEKVVIVMGSTGTGKSRLAIDLATRFSGEIINSDKMQVYKGLDIVTNKVTQEECRGVPHHLLGIVQPDVDFSALQFCHYTLKTLDSISQRDRLPIIAGGSNSYIEALVNNDIEFRSKYEGCFLWVDVSLPVLYSFVSERVDRMVEAGLVDEVRRLFQQEADYSRGIRRAIGVPEMDQFLRAEKGSVDEKTLARLLVEAIDNIKNNTCKLAGRQLQKIHRLRDVWGWNLHRLDATEVFLKRGREADQAWEKLVLEPSEAIVRQLVTREDYMTTISTPLTATTITTAVMGAAVAAASH